MVENNTINTVVMGMAITAVLILAIKIFNKEKDNLTVMTQESDDDDDYIDSSQLPDVVKPTKKPSRKSKYFLPNECDDMNTCVAKDIVIGKKLQRRQKPNYFTDKEIKKYQNKVFSAEDHFNCSSKNAIGAQDRLNEMFVTQGNEMCGEMGQTIAEVYDKITANTFHN